MRCSLWRSIVHFSTVRTSGYRKTDCIRENCDYMVVLLESKRGETGLSLFPRILNKSRYVLSRLSTYFLCHKFIYTFIRTFICTFIHTSRFLIHERRSLGSSQLIGIIPVHVINRVVAWGNPFPDFFCFLGVIDINSAIMCFYFYPLLLNNRPCEWLYLYVFVASSILLYSSSYRGDRREFSWKSTRKN